MYHINQGNVTDRWLIDYPGSSRMQLLACNVADNKDTGLTQRLLDIFILSLVIFKSFIQADCQSFDCSMQLDNEYFIVYISQDKIEIFSSTHYHFRACTISYSQTPIFFFLHFFNTFPLKDTALNKMWINIMWSSRWTRHKNLVSARTMNFPVIVKLCKYLSQYYGNYSWHTFFIYIIRIEMHVENVTFLSV